MTKLIVKVFVMILLNLSVEKNVFCQLDLPDLPPPTSAKPEVIINSYTNEKIDKLDIKSDTNNLRYDGDRSQRFGPPYDSNDDEYPVNRGDRNRIYARNNGDEYYKDHEDEKFYQRNNNERLSDPPLRDRDSNYRNNKNNDRVKIKNFQIFFQVHVSKIFYFNSHIL